MHLAASAVLNAPGTSPAGRAGKPLWRLLVDMTPEELVARRRPALPLRCPDPRGGTGDARGSRAARKRSGWPTWNRTATRCTRPRAGWLGYGDDKLRRLCHEAVDEGYDHVKLKVGANLDEDVRRTASRARSSAPTAH